MTAQLPSSKQAKIQNKQAKTVRNHPMFRSKEKKKKKRAVFFPFPFTKN